MKRFLIFLPILLLGAPLLIALLIASSPAPPESPTDVHESADASRSAADSPQKPTARTSPQSDDLTHLAADDPIGFLDLCLQHCRDNVRSYRCLFQKQERIGGKLQPRELIAVDFLEKPHSVLFRWLEGARKADRALYVDGQNGGKMLARPASVLARKLVGDIVTRDVDGPDARESGRYPLSQFGIRKAMDRTLQAWRDAQQHGQLHVRYLGEHKVREAGDRVCYKLRRFYDAPDASGIVEYTIYVDKENLLQVGSVLKGQGNKLIGEYFFKSIELNPTFKAGTFESSALRS